LLNNVSTTPQAPPCAPFSLVRGAVRFVALMDGYKRTANTSFCGGGPGAERGTQAAFSALL